MNDTVQPQTYVPVLSSQFGMTQWALRTNIAGVTHEQSIVRVDPGINSIHWLVGHLLAVRNILLPILGTEPFWSEETAAPYRPPLNSGEVVDVLPFAELAALSESSHEAILRAIQGLDRDRLEAPSREQSRRNDRLGAGQVRLPRVLPRGTNRHRSPSSRSAGRDRLNDSQLLM